MPQLKKLIRESTPTKIIAVGDVVSRETQANGIHVDIRIIDHKSLRKPTERYQPIDQKMINVKNPAGVITSEALEAIKRAMKNGSSVIVVEGEEDLLTLPCITESPDHSFVLYGQPKKGLVIVEVDPRTKMEAKGILERMLKEESS